MPARNDITQEPKSTADVQAAKELRRSSTGKAAGANDPKAANRGGGARAMTGRRVSGSPRGGSL